MSGLISAATARLRAALATVRGASMLGHLSPYADAVETTQDEINQRTVSVFDFMTPQGRLAAVNGAVFDHAQAVQRAIDAVSPVIVGGLKLRAGTVLFDQRYPLLVRTVINATNSRANGTRSRDGLRLQGVSLVGETGPGTAIIETTGSQWLELDGIIAASSGANASTVGLMQACSAALPQTQNQQISLRIFMNEDVTANNGLGTVGLWNYGAEENTYESTYVHANVPLFMTGHKQSPNLGARMPESYQAPLALSHSCGVNTFSGETFLAALGRQRPSLITEDVNSVRFENVYMANIGESDGGGNIDAWWQFGAFQGGVIQGTIEGHSSIRVNGVVAGSRLQLTFGAIHDPMAPMINQVRGGQGWIENCDITFHNAESKDRQLFQCLPSAPNEKVSCYVKNTIFRVNSERQFCIVPENVAWNPNTGNVSIYAQRDGAPYHYRIEGNRRVKIDIPTTLCRVEGGAVSAEICRFVGPSVFGEAGGANAVSAALRIQGVARIASATTSASSVHYIDATILMIINAAGVLGVAGPTTVTASMLDQNPAGNSITALTLSTSVTDVTGRVMLAPALAGANRENVEFTGSVEMTWAGNEARAPRLE